MVLGNRARSVRAVISASVLACTLASVAWAGRDFTPQAGTWIVSEELNGKPGRGLAIDVQGNTFFMQVFAYEKNGDATFYAVTGQMNGNSVTAPLMRYRGGRSFGSDARDGVEDKSLGNVTVKFTNGLQGTVQFPGEPERAIERFQMMGADFSDKYWTQGRRRDFRLTALDAAMQPMWQRRASLGKSYTSPTWTVVVSGDDGARQRLDCTQRSGQDVFICTNDGVQAADYSDLGLRSMQLRIADVDIAGAVGEVVQGVVRNSTLTGISISAAGDGAVILGCGSVAYGYVGDLRSCSRVSTPVSGTWVVEDEFLGKPGRGLAIDVQNGMVLTQVFNYATNGAPTFHMGSGPYQGMEAAFELNSYQGGRYVGGPAASGSLAEATGTVALRFSFDGTEQSQPNRTHGSVQFPGEAQKKIVRMALESAPTAASTLLGQWWLNFRNETAYPIPSEFRLVNLSTLNGDVVSSDDGSVRCERPPSELLRMECVWNRAGESWTAYFLQEANNRSQESLQIRDRHGNLMGLGNVRLDD